MERPLLAVSNSSEQSLQGIFPARFDWLFESMLSRESEVVHYGVHLSCCRRTSLLEFLT